jgi:3-hydroxyisobutyrate dehydrogenase-like beta-hydroxyacid dehydrogenase
MSNVFSTGGVIGLGGIGGGVATCLQRSGQLSAIYDVRAESAANVPGAPAMSASPRDLAAASDCVLIAVLNGAQTIAVLSGPDGVLAANKPGQMVILRRRGCNLARLRRHQWA